MIKAKRKPKSESLIALKLRPVKLKEWHDAVVVTDVRYCDECAEYTFRDTDTDCMGLPYEEGKALLWSEVQYLPPMEDGKVFLWDRYHEAQVVDKSAWRECLQNRDGCGYYTLVPVEHLISEEEDDPTWDVTTVVLN